MKTLAELVAEQRALLEAAKAQNREFTAQEAETFDALNAKIEAAEKNEERERLVAGRERTLDQPADPFYRPTIVPGAPSQNNKKLDDGGFSSLGEFIAAVRFGDSKGRIKNMDMGTGANGGFAVPEQFRADLLRISPESAIVRPRAAVIPAGDPPDAKITMPAFTQGADGVFGGVTVGWIGEGGAKPATEGHLEEISLEPKEVAAHTVVTDKLLRNWSAASAFISNLLRGAITAAEDFKFLRGNGVGCPLGVINAPGAVKVVRNTAATIIYADIVAMLAKLMPDSVGKAVWIANQSALPKIMTLQDANGNYIFIQGNATAGVPATLAGIPIRFNGRTPTLGTEGDLMLVDFSYYLIKDGAGPFVAASEHVHFTDNKTVIKAFWNVDGQGWVKNPLTLEDGSTTVSPYVILK